MDLEYNFSNSAIQKENPSKDDFINQEVIHKKTINKKKYSNCPVIYFSRLLVGITTMGVMGIQHSSCISVLIKLSILITLNCSKRMKKKEI